MIQKILNSDFVLQVQILKDKGYTYKQISEMLKDKYFLKSCSERTVRRAYEKKMKKADRNRTRTGQEADN